MRLSSARALKSALYAVSIASLLITSTACSLWSESDETGALAPGQVQPSPMNDRLSQTAIPIARETATAAGPRPTATAQPTVAIEDLRPSTQLAYFHSISPNGDSPEILATSADFIVLTYGDEGYRDQLRMAGYDGVILQYLNASQVNGPGPYSDSSAACDAGFEPHRNGIAREHGIFCRDLHPHEDWFLHNDAGERLYSIIDESSVWYHMNPGNPGWQQFASRQMARDAVGPDARGFDGLLLDNVELSLTRLQTQAQNADGVVREFDSDAAYRDAWSNYLQHIRVRVGSDIPIWADLVSDPNTGTTWAAYLAHLDGVMSPAFATGYEPLTVAEWQNNLSQAEDAIADGKGLVAVGIGSQGDADLQRFALASYLLVTDGTDAYFRYMSNESDESLISLWLYPDYDIRLGAALGPRTKSGLNWRREFQCGYVEVNPSQHRGMIVQSGCSNGTAP